MRGNSLKLDPLSGGTAPRTPIPPGTMVCVGCRGGFAFANTQHAQDGRDTNFRPSL
jgi:hypothetical protein